MSWDHMAWQLELDRLTATANEHAFNACRALVEGGDVPLREAIEIAHKWQAIQTQIDEHGAAAEKLRAGGNGE